MNLVFFILLILISFIVVRIGGIALKLTGLEWSIAKFQALSCFTGTGFTTNESEVITRSTQRRRIARYLMMLGHAGLVTLIATFANSFREITHWHISLINLLIIIVAVLLINSFFSKSKIGKKISNQMEIFLIKRNIIKPVFFQELVSVPNGLGLASLEICEDNRIDESTIGEFEKTFPDLKILARIRANEWMANPSPESKLLSHDSIICYGNLKKIKKKVHKHKQSSHSLSKFLHKYYNTKKDEK